MTRLDPLGNRMKLLYERATHVHLPGRTHTVIRVDGRAFHTYTRDLTKPFDVELMEDLTTTARALCETIQGAYLAYAQSDEISVLAYDARANQSEAWFDGDLQKIVSVAASIATTHFANARWLRALERAAPDERVRLTRTATFDARAFTIPDPVEAANYLIWRQRDAVRNSISMAARAYMSHRQCEGLTSDQLQDALHQLHGVNWNDYDPRFKRGTWIYPVTRVGDATFVDRRSGVERTVEDVERREWVAEAPPTFYVRALRGYVPGLSDVVNDHDVPTRVVETVETS